MGVLTFRAGMFALPESDSNSGGEERTISTMKFSWTGTEGLDVDRESFSDCVEPVAKEAVMVSPDLLTAIGETSKLSALPQLSLMRMIINRKTKNCTVPTSMRPEG
jgi:hypothetical protein